MLSRNRKSHRFSGGINYRTEIVSPANEQYKGRKRPFQIEPEALFQMPQGAIPPTGPNKSMILGNIPLNEGTREAHQLVNLAIPRRIWRRLLISSCDS